MAPHIPAKMPPRSIVAAALLSAASANHIGLPRMYLYGTNVADLSRIDRDQYAIEKTLGGEGLHSASFAKALALYEEGGHSKAYARLHFKADEEGSGPPLDATGVVHGVTEEGIKIDGKVIHEGSRNAAHIDVLYEHQFDGSKCMVGALPMIRMEKTDGCFAAGGTVEPRRKSTYEPDTSWTYPLHSCESLKLAIWVFWRCSRAASITPS